ncbi:hypothetical protein BLSTO_00297 [Blastocystis sp. subtype 1]
MSKESITPAFNTFALGVEVECDSLAEVSKAFSDTCFVKDTSLDRDVGDLLDVIRSDITSFVPKTNYIALGRNVQKALKKCNEFPELFEQMSKEREERLKTVRLAIEEEKKALDLQFRARAQEMKKACNARLSELELQYSSCPPS